MQALVSDGKLFHCSVFRVQKKAHPKLKSKPSEAGLFGRGGAGEQSDAWPSGRGERCGLCPDDGAPGSSRPTKKRGAAGASGKPRPT